ncbi:hypothetical protein PMIN06_013012 [Paraphaeosphaeria minitans]|uniref:F-box domain-containing protein n=1 Tax=Paraphaeosphaeria minitans TaxID=565426 RepID=A0A9P6KS19_9PLEO|nr:hypothetical protein PMIN01_05142 [Paraphaeosphaeria minitans]
MLVDIISSLTKLQHLTLCIDTSFSLFEGAINASSGDVLLRLNTIQTLHVSKRFTHLLHYCPNVRNLAISRTPGEPAYDSAFSNGQQPSLVAPRVTQLELKGIVLLCRVARLVSLSLEFPNTQVLRLTENSTHCFQAWSCRVGENFQHVKVLAVSRQFSEPFLVCGPRNGSDGPAPFAGADDVARLAFGNIATLEELWLEPDNIARRVCGPEPGSSVGSTSYRGGQEDQVGSDPWTETDVRWVWTRPSDPLVRPVEWIV